jgi:oligosaccharide repeat unit polymerase
MSEIDSASYILIFLTAAMAAAMFYWSDRKTGNIPFFSPLRWFSVGFLILFVIQPINHLYYDKWEFEVFDSVSFQWMQFACFLSGLSFLLGWVLRPEVRFADSVQVFDGPLDTRATYWTQFMLLIVPTAIGVFGIAYWYGGTIDSFLSGERSGVINAAQAGYYSLTIFAFCATLALALVGLIAVQRNIFSLPGLISTLLLFIFAVVSIQLGARLRILFMFMGVLGAIAAQVSRKSFIKIIALSGMIMVFFVYAQGRLRYEFAFSSVVQEWEERLDPGEEGLYYSFFMKGDFDAFENGIAVLNAVPRDHDFLYGRSILSLLYNPIPRIWWPDKPTLGSASILEATQFGRRAGGEFNIAVCLPAELYVNFSWPGVIFGMMLFGYLSRTFYETWAISPNRSKGLVNLGLFCAYILLVLRGSFHSMTAYYLYVVSWMIFSSVVASRLSRL